MIKILFDDGTKYMLPDISYEHFQKSELYKKGFCTIAYKEYLRKNGMKELSDFNSQSTSEITLIDENQDRGRVLKFKLVYDSDDDEFFNEKEYFEKV